MKSWPNKDSTENLDYSIDWAARLNADTIATSTWIVPSGITKTDESNTTTLVTIWLSGGTTGQSYSIENRITTAAGRLFVHTERLIIREQ